MSVLMTEKSGGGREERISRKMKIGEHIKSNVSQREKICLDKLSGF